MTEILFGQHQGTDVGTLADKHPAYLYALLNHYEEGDKDEFFRNAWKNLEMGAQLIPLGKFKGQFQIRQLKTSYLQYILDNVCKKGDWLKHVIESVLDSRAEANV